MLLPSARAVSGILTVISEEALVSIGLNDRLCGAIGVISVAGTSGLTIQPPALMLYAVLPLGVATIKPVVSSKHISCSVSCRAKYTQMIASAV
jgi:hypothetical protein